MRRLWYYIRLFGFARAWNLAMLGISYFLSNLTGKNFLWGKPYFLSIEPIAFCNLHCPGCELGSNEMDREQGILSFEDFKKVVDQVGKHVLMIQLFFQGEPLLHEEIGRMADYAFKKRMLVIINSNGLLLSEDRVAERIANSRIWRIILSVDGINQDVYQIYRRGGEIRRLESGVRKLLSSIKKNGCTFPKLYAQFIVMKHNEHQAEEFPGYAKKLGISKVRYKSPQLNLSDVPDTIPQSNKFRRYYLDETGMWGHKPRKKKACSRLWFGAVVSWDLKLLPCCFDKSAKHCMGSLADDSFSCLWKSNKYSDFRKRVGDKDPQIDMCFNCPEGLKTVYKKYSL